MSNRTLTHAQAGTIHNCLLDFLESGSLTAPSFLPVALGSLLADQGTGIEMSGLYISSDPDPDNVPEYLQDGIAFEFMGEHVVLPFGEAIACIVQWCAAREDVRSLGIDLTLAQLQDKFR